MCEFQDYAFLELRISRDCEFPGNTEAVVASDQFSTVSATRSHVPKTHSVKSWEIESCVGNSGIRQISLETNFVRLEELSSLYGKKGMLSESPLVEIYFSVRKSETTIPTISASGARWSGTPPGRGFGQSLSQRLGEFSSSPTETSRNFSLKFLNGAYHHAIVTAVYILLPDA